MSKVTLNQLNNLRKTLKQAGLSLNEEQEQRMSELEEEIIKNEILPIIKTPIESALSQVQRELVLLIDYKPGQKLTIHISRDSNITANIPDAKEVVLDPEVEHGSREPVSEPIKRTRRTSLAVRFPDGSEISSATAAKTLEEVVRRIGVGKVRSVVEEQGLVFSKVPVISNRRDAKYGNRQKALGNGWLLMTHSNNGMKKQFLECVSDALGLGLKIELKNKE